MLKDLCDFPTISTILPWSNASPGRMGLTCIVRTPYQI